MSKASGNYSLKTIAAELGFSKAAISLVLSGKGSQVVSQESERKILDFCRKVNYRPNIHARRMNSREVKNVGVLLNHGNPLSEFNTAEIVGGVASEAELAGYRATVQLCREGMSPELIFDWLRDREIDGLVYYGVSMPKEWIDTFKEEGRLVVGVGIEPQDGLKTVNIDNRKMSAEMARHLIERGAKDFFFLSGGKGNYPNQQRKLGLLDALRGRGLSLAPENLMDAGFSMDKAQELAARLCDEGRLKKGAAMLCANDAMAVGALMGLKSRGVKIPQDVLLAGCDNILLGRVTEPPISTYDYLAFDQGREAFKLLHRMISGDGSEAGDIVLKSHLIVRGSA